MSYVDPAIRTQFESLSIDLKNAILEMDVKLYTMNDLMNCLQKLADE